MASNRTAPPTTRSDLTELVNVGPAVARHLGRVGITEVAQLAGRDPLDLFEELCAVDGVRHDPCLLDTFLSAVEQADGAPGRPWWAHTDQRKALLADR